jgi:hypothetical protein
MGESKSTLYLWLVPTVVTVVISTVLMVVTRLFDFWVVTDSISPWFKDWIFVTDAERARATILQVSQTLAGVFAITITVVAIVVQLSATRYTSRVVDLFLSDFNNLFIFFLYVVPLVYGMWLANVIDSSDYSRVATGVFMIMATFAIIAVIPYFQYVFVALKPQKIITQIEDSIEKSLRRARGRPEQVTKIRKEVTESIRQLSDITLSSISQSDIVLSLDCIRSMRQVAVYYLRMKSQLDRQWFEVDSGHIVGLSEEMWREIVQSRIWLEMEIFKQYELAFTSTLRKVRDINSHIARNLREIAEVAAVTDDDRTLEFMIKGFNTLIMYSLSERDIRTAVNVLYQYRLLAEAVLYRPFVLERIANHMKYYGQNSQRRRIYFIMDAVAYDLRALIELTFDRFPENGQRLLDVFLQLDQIAETQEDWTFLRGVRKSQALLAGFFIRRGNLDLAKRIQDDMASESQEFLRTVRRDLFSTQSREFWEIEDRGVSFYYVEEAHRESVEQFFAGLIQEPGSPKETAQIA